MTDVWSEDILMYLHPVILCSMVNTLSAWVEEKLSPEKIQKVLNIFDSEDQKKAFLDMKPEDQKKFADEIFGFVKHKSLEVSNKPDDFAEKVLQKAANDAKEQELLETQKTEARKTQDDEVARLKALLDEKDDALKKANKTIKSNEKDMQAMATLEFGPKNITKLLLLKRQQDKMDYFLKKDPMAGMIYIYNSGMVWVRHLKRAIHGKKLVFGLLRFQEDPAKVKKQFQEYIANLKETATTPKQRAIVNQIAEKIKLINDKYVDLYNKEKGPQKFNS